MIVQFLATAASAAPPARGAALDQVAIGTVVAMLATSSVIWVIMAHRDGRISWLARLGVFGERVSGLPAWAALPSAVAGGSLVIAVFGFYWDVAKHIDTGRDPGPFGTAAHYPILIGLFGIALAGFLAIGMGAPTSDRTSIRITSSWRAPLGGVLIFLCGSFALLGFPLDDVWHALFGQDVTLWGPTHVLMIGGASLATLGVWVLLVEGQRARPERVARVAPHPLIVRLRTIAIAGGFLLGLSTLQGEFDYGVPQFQLLYQPILLMIAAGVGLTAARIKLGRFGALQAVAFFLLIRGALTLIIGPIFQMSTLHFPLYVVEAALVELAALRVSASTRPITLGAVSGALIGTVGLAAEWGWSHLWMPLPWTTSMLLPAAILGFTAALSAAILGGFIGRALNSDAAAAQHAPRALLPVAALAVVFCIGFPLPMNAGKQARASVALTAVGNAPAKTAQAMITLEPRNAAKNAQWVTLTAWQGGGLVVDRIKRVSEGVYRTTQPIPIDGNWKTVLRIEHGRALDAVPVYMPADPAIPAKAIPASANFTRAFERDKKLLQREAVGGAWWLATPAYLLLLGIATSWLIALGRGLRRLERSGERSERVPRPQGLTTPAGASA